MADRTPVSFFTGLLSGLAADYSGSGPTYRRWRNDTPSGPIFHLIGLVIGCLTQMSLMLLACYAAWADHTGIALAAALLIGVLMISANYIAARLP